MYFAEHSRYAGEDVHFILLIKQYQRVSGEFGSLLVVQTGRDGGLPLPASNIFNVASVLRLTA